MGTNTRKCMGMSAVASISQTGKSTVLVLSRLNCKVALFTDVQKFTNCPYCTVPYSPLKHSSFVNGFMTKEAGYIYTVICLI